MWECGRRVGEHYSDILVERPDGLTLARMAARSESSMFFGWFFVLTREKVCRAEGKMAKYVSCLSGCLVE